MESGHRSPHQANHSNNFIAKGLQNRESYLFQLFNNVPWMRVSRVFSSEAILGFSPRVGNETVQGLGQGKQGTLLNCRKHSASTVRN